MIGFGIIAAFSLGFGVGHLTCPKHPQIRPPLDIVEERISLLETELELMLDRRAKSRTQVEPEISAHI